MLKSIVTRSGSIALSDTGTGPVTVLMLHGNSACRQVFTEQIGALSGSYRTIAVDYAGHGDSSDAAVPARDYTLAGHADSIAEVLRQLEVGPLVIVGVSLGGHVALELTAGTLDVRGLVLTGCPPFAKSPEGIGKAFKPGPALGLSGKEALTSDEVELYLDLVGPGPAEARSTYRASLQRTDGRARSAMVAGLMTPEARDQRQLAEAITSPVALINGADDQLIELDYTEGLAYRRLWKGKGLRIDGAAHAPPTSHPRQFNKLLAEFIADTATG